MTCEWCPKGTLGYERTKEKYQDFVEAEVRLRPDRTVQKDESAEWGQLVWLTRLRVDSVGIRDH